MIRGITRPLQRLSSSSRTAHVTRGLSPCDGDGQITITDAVGVVNIILDN